MTRVSIPNLFWAQKENAIACGRRILLGAGDNSHPVKSRSLTPGTSSSTVQTGDVSAITPSVLSKLCLLRFISRRVKKRRGMLPKVSSGFAGAQSRAFDFWGGCLPVLLEYHIPGWETVQPFVAPRFQVRQLHEALREITFEI
jgi:hypothetical protein